VAARFSCLAALALALIGCGDDEAGDVDAGPTGNPTLVFADPPSDGEPHCLSLDAPDAQVPLLTATSEVLLRPPGGCLSYAQCGHLALFSGGELWSEDACGADRPCASPLVCDPHRLRCGPAVNGVLNNETAVHAIDLVASKLGQPYHDGSIDAGTGEPDYLRLRVTLMKDDGAPLFDHSGQVVEDVIQVITAPECP
jgi:hypothetical protein